ncbi:hypothetical protein ACE38V_15245 [Cytobacillus sp. Hz8]|uniref:hypothetical protein n=1 Tax=Cytobacillus sp. Hz8 TaxID=3347168 RepID=UPI0035E25267
MKLLSLKNSYNNNSTPIYYGLQGGYLDIHTLRYRVFGAVWKLINRKRYIMGYWFADNEEDIHVAIQKAGFSKLIQRSDLEIKEVYHCIRKEQEKENWSNRTRLPFLTVIKEPWKNLSDGWFILQSSTNFPCVLTCIQKKRNSVWIEHVQVCENQNDRIKFLNLINHAHNIHLVSKEIQHYRFEK